MLYIHFIRHAQSEGNIKPHIQGGSQPHLNLTELGIQQAQHLGKLLEIENLPIHKIVVSPAIRAQHTATLATQHLTHTHEYDDRLLERSYGEWEGQPKENLDPEHLAKQEHQGFAWKAPGGESVHDVIARTEAAIHELQEHYNPEEDRHILWFGHATSIRIIASHLLKSPELTFNAQITNTSRSTLRFDGANWRLMRWNDTRHL